MSPRTMIWVTAPEDWVAPQLRDFERILNGTLDDDQRACYRIKVLPGGSRVDTEPPCAWISRRREDCAGVPHYKLVASMVAEAHEHGMEPFDFSDPATKTPNIYLRGVYIVERDGRSVPEEWVEDRLMMPVRPSAQGTDVR